ncbi:MAG: HlyD family efflux transporter periplasmic adaptor subunit [Croceibacterium sp.]
MGEQFAQIGNQNSELGRQLDLTAAQAGAEVALLDQQASGSAATIASLERQRAFAGDQIRLAESAARRAERLAAQGAGTQRQVEDGRSALLARRAEFETLGDQLIAQRTALRTAQSERTRRQLEDQRAQSLLQGQRAQLAEQQAQLSRTDQVVLTSPIGGVVGDVAVQIGQQSAPGRSAVSVIPTGSRLEIWLYAPSKAVGNARPGQRVRLQFDAFPYQKYGSGLGVVTAIAKVPTDPGNLDPGLNLTEPVFRIRVRIDRLSAGSRIDTAALRPGMTLNAKLETERRSLWQILLGPVTEGLR